MQPTRMAVEASVFLTLAEAKRLWIKAQRLDVYNPFGDGPESVCHAVEHLGYVQIDTINVVERCHHHILFNRIPNYKRSDLLHAQRDEKSVFEYWTHALSYVPTRDYRFYMSEMKRHRGNPSRWFGSVSKADIARVIRLIKKQGPISIRDIDNDVLVDKNHPWASRKPSKKALELGFYGGELVISERVGMLKKYELANRHFEFKQKPKAARANEFAEYLLARALRTQSFVSVDSSCYLVNSAKPAVKTLIDAYVKQGKLLSARVKGVEKTPMWIRPEEFESLSQLEPSQLTHILSPFDPIVIQRKRLQAIFGYEHKFEAYVPKAKRRYGYFSLPVLSGEKVIAVLDLKTDREQKKLLVRSWHWTPKNKNVENKQRIESALDRFEKFQLNI